MKHQIKVWGSRTFIVVLLVVGALQWGVPLYKKYFVPKKVVAFMPTAKVREGQFMVTFHEIGTLEAEKSVSAISEVEGKIIKIVDDGTTVAAGAQIAVLDTSALKREARNQQLVLRNAEEDVKRAQADLEMLKAANLTELGKAMKDFEFSLTELDRAKKELERKTRLAEAKLVAGDEQDQAELNVKAKELSVAKQALQLELQKKEILTKEILKAADVKKVEFVRDIHKTAFGEMQGRLQKATITAPAPGLVVISKDWTPDGVRKLQEGDNVRPRQSICSLPDLSSMQVKAQVGEADAPRIKVGISVLVKLEAIPGKTFHGTVKDISSLATEASPWGSGGAAPGSKNFEVTIALKESDPRILKPGMTADAEFICKTVDRAVYVPIESVVERDGKTYVFVKEGGKFRQAEVKTGIANDMDVVIIRGLKKGEIIALRDPTRPLDEQESTEADVDKKSKEEPAPIPTAVKIKRP